VTIRVCIVEDDLAIRESLRFLFEDAEAFVEEAADGEAALGLLRTEEVPRVLLLDRLMPGLDGVGVLRVLAAEPAIQQRTAILFMSARIAPPDAELAKLLKTLGVMTINKPFDVNTLLMLVERAWQRLIGMRDGYQETARGHTVA
jgi:two-component system OmpR family response regulator